MNDIAPDGFVFVCGACGKLSKDRYGYQAESKRWDESCMLNAVLCRRSHLVLDDCGRVTEVKDGGVVEDAASKNT
jgi:hypothetical protein